LRVFGCLCYPNLYATTAHKLAPRSTRCVFLGYPREHKGYRCFDLHTRRVIISRHVIFDESIFPYSSVQKCAGNDASDAAHPPGIVRPIVPRAAPTSYHRTTPATTPTPPPGPSDPAPRLLASAPGRSPPPTHQGPSPHTPPHQPNPSACSPRSNTPTSDRSPPASMPPTPASPAPHHPTHPSPAANSTNHRPPPLPPLPPNATAVEPPENPHQMITRGKAGYFMPKQNFSLHV
jgi:hypothetical protein